jgi:hypothetical protein
MRTVVVFGCLVCLTTAMAAGILHLVDRPLPSNEYDVYDDRLTPCFNRLAYENRLVCLFCKPISMCEDVLAEIQSDSRAILKFIRLCAECGGSMSRCVRMAMSFEDCLKDTMHYT